MRLVFTSDIHVDLNGPDCTRALARRFRELRADVAVVAGDIATDRDILLRTLTELRAAVGELLVLPGNHDVWCRGADRVVGHDARWRQEELWPQLCAEVGAQSLDGRGLRLGELSFVGVMGWYDFSFRDPALEVPEAAYRAGEWGGVRWMDVRNAPFVVGGEALAPEAVLDRQLRRLDAALRRVETERVVAVTHHLPFAAQAWRSQNPVWRFVNAFLGSVRLGERIAQDPRVELVISGHSHIPSERELGGLRAMVSPLGYGREWREGSVDAAVERAVRLVELR